MDQQGRENFRELRITSKIPSGTVLQLSGSEALNEYAVPGSYFGETPKAWVKGKDAPGAVLPVQEIYRKSAAENSARFRAMTRSIVTAFGKKEFTIVCRFKGRHFNDTRVMLAGSFILRSRLGASRYALTWLDAYPPAAIPVSIDANERIDNGDTLTSTFDFYLDNGSIVDKGGSRVSDVRLLISKCPAGQRWDYWNWTGDTIPPVTLAQMLQSVHTIIPYQVRVPDVTVNSVKWEDIIPTEWKSGDYYLGVYTSDEFGNSGLAPMAFDGGFYTNPLKVTVISGK